MLIVSNLMNKVIKYSIYPTNLDKKILFIDKKQEIKK